MKKTLIASAAIGVLATVGLVACESPSPVSRPGQPSVLTGTDLPDLVGRSPDEIVAFRRVRTSGSSAWKQIPVQVDERKVVGFGSQPGSNATVGVTGTVYGNGSAGVMALQYVDPNTFVGADSNPAFDADDELVFMVEDAGSAAPADAPEPAGVLPGSGVEVRIDDPQTSTTAWTYLFVSDGSLDPAAGQDYVDYTFQLTSGPYKSTYRRADGPNPETSRVVTDAYRIDYPDRWYESDWRITYGGASGVDILDGHKNQFAVNSCGRSNKTFADGEGAFVANIDGPVRGIRSYIGANSGPLTQRTHVMYRHMEEIRTDLRVHEIPSIMDFVDYSAAATGMKYASSTLPGGVTIDGVQDAVPNGIPTWESVSGGQGTIVTTVRTDKDFSTSEAQFYRDQQPAPEAQCWGDGAFLGASGQVLGAVPNTDPQAQSFSKLASTRWVYFLPPAPADAVRSTAEAFAADGDEPLTVSVTSYAP